MKSQILLGDCLDVLKTLPDASVSSVVTDCPYGLGTREPTVEEIIAYLQGADLDHGGDFMGHKWSVPSVAVWRECYRVLQPGGHLLSFGGTRTWDLISLGIRAAGFENRDTIASFFGVTHLEWLQGSGFPKSLSIQKHMEKMGLSPQEIEQWRGWGTATKPSHEPILVFRKPIAESTVAKQVLKTGTGAINIDGCRVRTSTADLSEMQGRSGASSENAFPGAGDAGIWEPKSSGRWPSNIVFSHSPNCTRVGSKKVDAPVINRFTDGAKPFGNGAGHAYESEQRGDADGKEEIAIYDCQDGCPVKTLDEQSGDRPVSGTAKAGNTHVQRSMGYHGPLGRADSQATTALPNDSGGASRFFPQFDQDQEPSYECQEGCPVKALDDQSGVLKTSGGVLNRAGIGFHEMAKGNQSYVPPSEGGASRFFPQFECVEGCPVKELGEQSGERHGGAHSRNATLRDSSYAKGADQPFVSRGHEDEGTAARFFPQFEQLEAPFMYATKVSKSERDAGLPKGTNVHPTVKNLALMRWLCRLVTQKGGTILDPYAGSGTTLVAALKEGFNFIGIERDPEFHRIATMRVEAAAPKHDIFDDMEDL